MKVQELLRVKQRYSPGNAPIPADRTPSIVAPVQASNRIAGRRERLGSHDTLPDVDPNDGGGDIPVALDCISAPNRDPTPNVKEGIGIACRTGSVTGSRSAPIGTPSLGDSTNDMKVVRPFRRGPGCAPIYNP